MGVIDIINNRHSYRGTYKPVPVPREDLLAIMEAGLNAPSGCPFRTRCPYAAEECAQSMPEFREAESGHFVPCHRLEKIG